MNFIDLKRENLATTYNGITYTKEMYKTATAISGVIDESYPNWDSAATYNVDDYVIVPELKSIYKNALTGNTGNFPLASETSWVFWGFVNSYNMFAADESIGSKTVGTDITITIDFNQMNSIGLVDIDFVGDLIITQVNNNTGEEVNNLTVSSRDISCSTFAQYCFSPIRKKKKLIITDLEWLPSSTLTLTFTGDVSIGTLGFGILENMGLTLYGTNLRWESKSLIKNDEFTGYREVLRYGKVRVLEVKVVFDVDNFNTTSQRIDELLDRNILFIPTNLDKFSELIQIGYMENFSIPLNNASKVQTSTTIVGVNK